LILPMAHNGLVFSLLFCASAMGYRYYIFYCTEKQYSIF
jgi:hypothetical protein